MFRTAMCPSSGELIVSIWHLVYVSLCRWPSGMQVWMKHPICILEGLPSKPAYQKVFHPNLHTRRSSIQTCLPEGLPSEPAYQKVFHPNLHIRRSSIQTCIPEGLPSKPTYQKVFHPNLHTRRSSIQTCIPEGHTQRVTYTRCLIDTNNSPDVFPTSESMPFLEFNTNVMFTQRKFW